MTEPAFERLMLTKHPDTEVTILDVYKIGEAFLNALGMMQVLGHESPGSGLDYTEPNGIVWHDLTRDFIALTSGRTHLAPGCQGRLLAFVQEWGWTRHQMNAAVEHLDAA